MYAGSTFVYLGRWLMAAMLYTPGTGSFKDATASIIFSQNQNDDILKM
jgi:hypothetical protein